MQGQSRRAVASLRVRHDKMVVAMRRHGKRLALFERVYGESGIYYCPICGDGHGQAALQTGELTLEHVPPDSVGGKAITLTCRRCNNPAGGTVDAAVSQRAEQMRFAEFILGRSCDYAGPAILEIGGDKYGSSDALGFWEGLARAARDIRVASVRLARSLGA